MAVREVLTMGDARLVRVARPVQDFDTRELHVLVAELFDAMQGAGTLSLAAPQLGVDLALVIFGAPQGAPLGHAQPIPLTVLANPVVEPLTTEQDERWEACLSIPGRCGMVPRFTRIRYRGLDARGQPIEREADGRHARLVQHACDHLTGTLYPMRLRDQAAFGFTSEPCLDADARTHG